MTFSSIRRSWFSRLTSLCLSVTFVVTMVITPRVSYAQGVQGLPEPGTMVNLSSSYVPLMLTSLTVHPENPLLMDFIVSTGNSGLNTTQVKKESDRLIKYFLACLTIPENDQWVNLSPYEKQRIVPEDLGQTVLGRDMLAQDYLLKQLTASLIYPEKNLGKNFWDKVYAKASQMYGTTQIPVNTFNKVWILPQYAKVYEHKDTVFVVKSHLRVMLDEDYLALTHQKNLSFPNVSVGNPEIAQTLDPRLKHSGVTNINTLGSQIIRQLILPAIEQEVNTGKNFANLRQIYNSMILAVWFKKNLKQALLNQVYTDKAKINGVNVDDPSIKEKIYQQYLQAYKKGVFNYIKEESVSLRGSPQGDEAISKGTTIARKYFSGGLVPVTDYAMATPEETRTAFSGTVGTTFDLAVLAQDAGKKLAANSNEAMTALPNDVLETLNRWSAENQWDDTVVKNIKDWYSSNAVNDTQRNALLRIISESKADKIKAGFSSEKGVLQPGTAGTRGEMENLAEDKIGSNYFSTTTIIQYTLSFVNWYKSTHQTGPAFITKEVRENSDAFGDIAAKVLLANGITVIRLNKPVSTPFASYLAKWMGRSKYGKPAFGYQISASHNKWADSGIKFMGPDGQQFMPDVMGPIAAGIPSLSDVGKIPDIKLDQNPNYHVLTDGEFYLALDSYFDELDSTLAPDFKDQIQFLKESGKKFVFTPVYGASGEETRLYLLRHGLMEGVHYSMPPDEKLFPVDLRDSSREDLQHIYAQKRIENSDPARPGVLNSAEKFADEKDVDLVFARDPDGDRFVMTQKINGEWRRPDGNQNLILMLHDRLSHSEGLDKSKMLVMRSHSTTTLLDKIASHFGVNKIIVTPVGFKYMGAKIIEMFQNFVGRYFFGGEESFGSSNGHINEKDGLSGLVNMLIVIARQAQQGKNVFDYLNEIYMEFGYPADVTRNISLPGTTKPEQDKARGNVLAALAKVKVGGAFAGYEIIFFKKEVDVEGLGQFHDGYDFILKDKGTGKEFRLLFRPSGTEPIFKYYFFWQEPITSNSVEELQKIISQTNGYIDREVSPSVEKTFREMAGDNAMSANKDYIDASDEEWALQAGQARPAMGTAAAIRQVDHAALAQEPGGIDLNSRHLKMQSEGEKVDMTFDPAMIAQFKRGDFSGVRIQILDVVPINLMPLLGLKEEEESGQLAKA